MEALLVLGKTESGFDCLDDRNIFFHFSSETTMPDRINRQPTTALEDSISPSSTKAKKAAKTGSVVKIKAV